MSLNDGRIHYPQIITDGSLNMDNPMCNPGCSHVKGSISTVLDDVTCPSCRNKLTGLKIISSVTLPDGRRRLTGAGEFSSDVCDLHVPLLTVKKMDVISVDPISGGLHFRAEFYEYERT